MTWYIKYKLIFNIEYLIDVSKSLKNINNF